MNEKLIAGFADEFAKNAGIASKIIKPVAALGALGAVGTIAAGEIAARGVHGSKQRYRAKLTGPLGKRSHLYANPATYG